MCGILGILSASGSSPSVDDARVIAMRDRMAHRGPDDAGLHRAANAVLAHRRLSVLDTSAAGHQPMLSADGRYSLVYNGELYNDAPLRTSLASDNIRFTSTSDTETILHLLALRGPSAIDSLRGMYALGFFDARSGDLLLARDPLGIKPLYYTIAPTPNGPELVFASEIPAILAHPHVSARPDPVTISSYLTTIRTTLGERTLFEGVRCVQPGEILRISTNGGITIRQLRAPGQLVAPEIQPQTPVRDAVIDSVRAHLRSDVPICCLLSGGLDSSIVAAIAKRELGTLHTFCSGAVSQGAQAEGEDFAFARQVASQLGTDHTEAPVTREMFIERWPEMIARLGLPLSTPNEVAINQVARTLRAAGKIVTLSGEGADELFAGYQGPMQQAQDFEDTLAAAGPASADQLAAARASFQIDANAWVPRASKHALLNAPVLAAIEGDALLQSQYTLLAADSARDNPESSLQAHLSFHRRVNLVGLLQRLDTATMLESVEGRTPFADASLASLAQSLPMARKFQGQLGTPGTKIALREAFAHDLPAQIIARAKASFPLPFQPWIEAHAPALRTSALAREFFTHAAIETVAAQPERAWSLAWPMTNLALWGQVWWK